MEDVVSDGLWILLVIFCGCGYVVGVLRVCLYRSMFLPAQLLRRKFFHVEELILSWSCDLILI